MEEKVYERGSFILQQGAITKEFFVLWKGEIDVFVTDGERRYFFDKLNEGSCFCVYQAFKADTSLLFDFQVATSRAYVFAINVDIL